ncbi:hypothetical protein IJG79_00770 [Candidatus Saccharibacteria bacterium]|nr:hypothetical protein [Candidatus Saccharibacteria bacterium]
MVKVSEKSISEDIIREAKILRLPVIHSREIAKIVSAKVISKLEKKAQKSSVTKEDLNITIAKEIRPYNKDLSFVYQNRGKII